MVPSDGKLINALVQSGVSRYGEFRLLDSLGILRMSGDVRSEWYQVPSTKEDIFKDKDIPLIAKRKLMKMLQFAIGEYEDSDTWRGETAQYVVISFARITSVEQIGVKQTYWNFCTVDSILRPNLHLQSHWLSRFLRATVRRRILATLSTVDIIPQ